MFYLMNQMRSEAKSPCHVCVAATVFKLAPREEHIFCGVIGKFLPVPVVACPVPCLEPEEAGEPASGVVVELARR